MHRGGAEKEEEGTKALYTRERGIIYKRRKQDILNMLCQHIEMIYESNTPPSVFTTILLHSVTVMPECPWVHGCIPVNTHTHTTLVAFIQKKNFNRKHISARQNKQEFNTQPLAEIEFQEETMPSQGPEQETTKERDGGKRAEQNSTCRQAFTLRKCKWLA